MRGAEGEPVNMEYADVHVSHSMSVCIAEMGGGGGELQDSKRSGIVTEQREPVFFLPDCSHVGLS